MKKNKPTPGATQSILWFRAAVAVLFGAMALYLAWFLVSDSEAVINNPYNARLSAFEERVIRGRILAEDGTVVAQNGLAADSNGTPVERRE